MKNEILVAMASDMKITKYESESDAQYVQRVLYSALACWIKAATLDRDMSQPNAVGASKKHIKEKCTQILEATLDRIPEARGYFYPEDAQYDAVTVVRKRLVQNGDIVNIGCPNQEDVGGSKIYARSNCGHHRSIVKIPGTR